MNLAGIPSSALARLCEEYHVRELYVFGSVVAGELSPASDLDFIVKFEHDHPEGAFNQFMGFQAALERHFNRPVDLLTLKTFRNPIFQAEVDRTKKLVYAA